MMSHTWDGSIGSPVITGVAGQGAVDHGGGGPASVQVDGVDHSVLLQERSHLPETHPATTQNQSWMRSLPIGPSAHSSSSLTRLFF